MQLMETVLAALHPDWLPAELAVPVHQRSGPTGETRLCALSGAGAQVETIKVALPVTFTPYASTQPCSARCTFCSENLRKREGGLHASRLRPAADYFDKLAQALDALTEVPMGLSLSGLEMTDQPAWFLKLLSVLKRHESRAGAFAERVLYSNGAGLGAPAQRMPLLEAMQAFGMERIEWSRHSADQRLNDLIMRFRPGISIADNACFEVALRETLAYVPVTLVCLLQAPGVASATDLLAYLAWAESLGVQRVVFREFSQLDASYAINGTARILARQRVRAERIARELLNSEAARAMRPQRILDGYYFWHIEYLWRGKMQVVLEASDYARMNALHASDTVYKLVFHANGRLTADWSPDERILLQL